MYQIAYAEFARSEASYREKKHMSPLSSPSVRQLRRLRSVSKVKDGRNSKVYELRRAAKMASGSLYDGGFLMCDEMKLKEGMVWNSITGKVVGLADDDLDTKSLLCRALSPEGIKVLLSKYNNQFYFQCLDKKERWNCEFFFNDGSLTGATLLRQFTQVLLSCEAIGSRVYGLVLDAGGNNAKFISILRDSKKVPDCSWLSEDLCYIHNPYDTSRRVYFYFCMTHGLKAMRNQLLASSQDGSKAFQDKDDVPFGWALMVETLERLKNSAVPRNVRITEKIVRPNNFSKMNVSDAKIAFEKKMMSFIE